MRKLLFFNLLLLSLASSGIAQKTIFTEQTGIGYSSGIKANAFAEGGNGGGIAFTSTGDFLLHNLIGIGMGFDFNINKINNRVADVPTFFADFKIIGQGQFRPYFLVDPGFCLYFNSIPDGTTQKGSFYTGAGAGVWFPSNGMFHLFLQAKYNYILVSTNPKGGYTGSTQGSIGLFNFLIGYKF